MTDSISFTGFVATVPVHRRIRDGVDMVSFRLGSPQRYFDRNTRTWVDSDTNWYTVSTFRYLANNVHQSVNKGDRVIVKGRLRVRRWEKEDRSGLAVDIDAECVGHDLAWGTARYIRTPAKDSALTPDSGTDEQPEEQAIVDGYHRPEVGQSEPRSTTPNSDQGPWDVAVPGSLGAPTEAGTHQPYTGDETPVYADEDAPPFPDEEAQSYTDEERRPAASHAEFPA
ncbi:single-stranded DNA-binding protein [Mycetocola zhadangensis]|uniref:Single-stranded DNA-binding protein n=1 Tax=Mycetocola zhadangensis TaxID=1164595 RepID=A0A3L7J5X3_9MICO|nr:single-stranded DNA-binding protein [Mycetocola zhadangensis]RLQ85910.1 single-stranded DNA-binding protein [Mycetocola zhadangensis]GGE86862.1 hypothetical protein GCM10011313_06670 [Mycetocola zhadangensis]